MNLKKLHQFLLDSNKAGYAQGDEKKWLKEPDGSTTIQFAQGNFRSHDNFFGGEPYGGRLVVFESEKAVWMMVYYGKVTKGEDPDAVFEILREALKQMPTEEPFRGPRVLRLNDLIYSNNWEGNIEGYSGKEKIENGAGKIVYQANYRGGLVDQREGV